MTEPPTAIEPVVLWHRRTYKVSVIIAIAVVNSIMGMAAFPTLQGMMWSLVWGVVCFACAWYTLKPVWVPDHPVVRVDAAGIWIRGAMQLPVPWSEIRSVRQSVVGEANPCICFNMVEGPRRVNVLSHNKGKPVELLDGPCDFYFTVPVVKNAKRLLAQVRQIMEEPGR